ncbi:HSPB1-associated protein 1 homolog [Denticeps clupeoides]|uniref:HSPB1-associated protein 1 homolog n=1 Tax=Denticeps clupeoides TaxID=299321 RepID=UPI0010A3FB2D|nr:HSPB1-associated protein 1 [Denticeps clupeoides]XP_028846596.1 HSPB1-associated protein 1 [Denticeps clupeoides]XP_028846597.1 HSPB1-associated protein 1 [Denticeps clupeoides]XP_028846599.1 HSPB1-associated protein 1 [Denticeps clupeoides]XP_028846600.1 HSPB1-associated protein 1 [Denticeps clupeoides]XP_028846601.1 HSPB1-associated protein 1 [Denticeps clupeoides]XP_028846602.1 HSPB1-associated protein 1 [Denticeps clupeoides]XP_028846603.1 HSPB1-associated protein 1 [Denticeps clupeoi
MSCKPFSPEEARGIVESLQQPAVFLDMTGDWPGLSWTADNLRLFLGDRTLRFRMGRRQTDTSPLFETQCSYVDANLKEFLCWTSGQKGTCTGPFCDYLISDYWAYADYKYIAFLFKDNEDMFKDVVWSDFGYPGINGAASTLWLGTEGANTPCHMDSYGCNLILQVQGRKRWHLFPPEDTKRLYPTRIPYEESSVFSQVNVLQPDLDMFPGFREARAHVVTLQPGQVLFVPRHWWHYVESVDPVTVSINSWMEQEADDETRVGEALTKTLVCAMKTTPSQDNNDNWLNPTEDGVTSHGENLQYLSLALQACMKRRRVAEVPSPAKQCSSGHLKRNHSGHVKTEDHEGSVTFGPHLIPVFCQTETHPVSPRSRSESEAQSSPTPISTNELLESLLHPELITTLTRLLLRRRTEMMREPLE